MTGAAAVCTRSRCQTGVTADCDRPHGCLAKLSGMYYMAKRIAACALVTALMLWPAVASAASPMQWSQRRCTNYRATFYKLHAFPTKAQISHANRVLKHHGCAGRVKRI
jgi:hypothetical protein